MEENAYTRYRKKNIYHLQANLNRKTDADIIAWLDSKDNVSGAVKQVIREHLHRKESICHME